MINTIIALTKDARNEFLNFFKITHEYIHKKMCSDKIRLKEFL